MNMESTRYVYSTGMRAWASPRRDACTLFRPSTVVSLGSSFRFLSFLQTGTYHGDSDLQLERINVYYVSTQPAVSHSAADDRR
jgi:hypothetical protein